VLELTKAQLRARHKEVLDELVLYAGGRAHLSKMLGIPLSTINSWIDRGMISKRGVERVLENKALKADFPKSRLRPEL
jgi:DNA-directed RNA polymerase specialized sigma24 family protein